MLHAELQSAGAGPSASAPAVLDRPRRHRGRLSDPQHASGVSLCVCGPRARLCFVAAQHQLRAVERLRLRAELLHARAAAAAAGEALSASRSGSAAGGALPGRHSHRSGAEDALQTLQLPASAAERTGETGNSLQVDCYINPQASFV